MPRPKPNAESSPQLPTPVADGPTTEVLTLAEAAAYLRLPELDVLRLHDRGRGMKVLDTDTLTLLLKEHPKVRERRGRCHRSMVGSSRSFT